MEKKLIVLKELAGNAPTSLNTLQSSIAPHSHALILFWLSIFALTACAVISIYIKEFLTHRKRGARND